MVLGLCKRLRPESSDVTPMPDLSQDPTAVYRVRVSSTREDKETLSAHTMYSDFYALRSRVAELYEQARTSAWGHLLAPILQSPFPRKRFFRDSRAIVLERMHLFKRFVGQLLLFRHHYLLQRQRHAHVDHTPLFLNLIRLLEAFLELRLQALQLLAFPVGPHEVCAICLRPHDQPRQRRHTWLHLNPCGHAFHVSCIAEWLLRKSSCPVCRATAKAGFLVA
ncbi:hypothetical protein ACHHYP_00210 [Achlya hypogyna]|uniref:RING-type domain-containing protein n=1 Tax=Achlya hypogyna TaxID=1202772 RepID=A0A1V9ZB58_ACHHY|nr:hypothetical protein ACHHYP_00210 [Achlya hypogyna]